MNREKEIFKQALELSSAEERMGFLKGACGGDSAMLERLLGLLRASEAATAFLPAVLSLPFLRPPIRLPKPSSSIIPSAIGVWMN